MPKEESIAVRKARQRVIYFRITEDEFADFSNLCEQQGARSVSDLARKAIGRLLADGHRQREDRELIERIQTLESLVVQMSEQLQQIVQNRQEQKEID